MKIGIDANPLLTDGAGGIEVYLEELVRRMSRLDPRHEFRLFFNFGRGRHQGIVDRFDGPGVRPRVCRVPRRIMSVLQWHAGFPVDWLVGRVDVMFYPSFVALPQRRGRVVVTVHDLIPLTHPEFCEPHHVREFKLRVPPSVKRADTVIVVSSYTGQLVQDWFGIAPGRIRCIPNGVHERYRPPEDPGVPAAVAARYGIRGPYLLFVGTMEPRKNLVRVIEAFGCMHRKGFRDLSLVLAGKEFWGASAIRAAIERLGGQGRVLTPGYVAAEDLPALYSGATAFLFPSMVEGFGIPPLEAMACGCPVLTSATPALQEVVGDAAITVDPTDADAIAEGLCRLAEDSALRKALRSRGYCRAKEFSWDRTAAETLAALEAA